MWWDLITLLETYWRVCESDISLIFAKIGIPRVKM